MIKNSHIKTESKKIYVVVRAVDENTQHLFTAHYPEPALSVMWRSYINIWETNVQLMQLTRYVSVVW
jgi:hypothetical protein